MSLESPTVSVRCGGSPFISSLTQSEEGQVMKQKSLEVKGLGMSLCIHVVPATQETETDYLRP